MGPRVQRTVGSSAVSILAAIVGCGSQAPMTPGAGAPPAANSPPSDSENTSSPATSTDANPGNDGAIQTVGPPAASVAAPTSDSDGPTLAGCQLLPPDNAWNTDISGFAGHPSSDAFIDSIGQSGRVHADFGTQWQGAPLGIAFNFASEDQELLAVAFDVEDVEAHLKSSKQDKSLRIDGLEVISQLDPSRNSGLAEGLNALETAIPVRECAFSVVGAVASLIGALG